MTPFVKSCQKGGEHRHSAENNISKRTCLKPHKILCTCQCLLWSSLSLKWAKVASYSKSDRERNPDQFAASVFVCLLTVVTACQAVFTRLSVHVCLLFCKLLSSALFKSSFITKGVRRRLNVQVVLNLKISDLLMQIKYVMRRAKRGEFKTWTYNWQLKLDTVICSLFARENFREGLLIKLGNS